MNRVLRSFIALSAFVPVVLAAPLQAQVSDEAGIFSPAAVREANKAIEQVRSATSPPKTVVVRTVPSVQGDVQQAAEGTFSRERVDGIQIFVTAQPRRLVVTTGRATEGRFSEGAQIRNKMLEHFRAGSYDDGLRAGVAYASQGLLNAFPSAGRGAAARDNGYGAGAPVDPAVAPRSSGETRSFGGFPLLLLLAVGALGLFALSRRNRRPEAYAGGPAAGPSSGVFGGGFGTGMNRGYGGPGAYYPPGGGRGGFGNGILGGLGGALAGNWIYDRLLGGGHSDAHASEHSVGSGTGTSYSPSDGMGDHGSVGNSASGDWGDSHADWGDTGSVDSSDNDDNDW